MYRAALLRSTAAVTAVLLLLAAVVPVSAHQVPGDSAREIINAPTHPLLQGFEWRSIGPVGQGGRVNDIAVHPDNDRTFLVGFATAGLWKTTNNGTTFRPVFDTYGTHSVGSVAIAPSDPSIVYVGTGEANNRQSSSFGGGVYRSRDGGETFQHIGLTETQTIARVRVHPTNPDIVWIAATGHLFGPNPERGVYMSTNGGDTWNHVLRVDENTGATDLVLHPTNPDILYAAMYQRRRSACCFVGGGPGSGMWKSIDGGRTWTRIEDNGLPAGTMGRIALAVTPADPDMVYAQIEVAADRATAITEAQWEAMEEQPDDAWSGVWRSTDSGRTWQFRSNENGRPMYFSQIRVSPQDAELVYVVDQQVHRSRDGGATFERLDGYGHVDQHAFWIDPDDHNHIMIGNDGSIDVSYDQGETWESLRSWAVGQPYHASVDMRRPYYVCTGLQDNGSWCGPSSVREGDILSQDWYGVGGGDGFYTAIDPSNPAIVYSESQNGNIRRLNLNTGESESIRPSAPDEEDPLDSNIRPIPSPELDIRWNWNTPFILSPHNPEVIYAGGNHLFISPDRGETWTMTEDLTKNIDRSAEVLMGVRNDVGRCRRNVRGQSCVLSLNDGVSDWSTITTISESAVVPGVLWVGTDDGNIQVSRNGGATWTEVSRNLPGGTTRHYISRVEASHHDPGTAFISIDGHRNDDLNPYVWVTRDYGSTWTDIAGNLPERGNVNTIRQDPRNPSLLYAGTEFGFFISPDGGGTWERFMPGLPVVRIDDVLVHPRENDLVLATHGRSIYILDDITALQALAPAARGANVHFVQPREAVLWRENIRQDREVPGDKHWRGENAPAGTALQYHLGRTPGSISLHVTDTRTGEHVRTLEPTRHQGLNRVQWDLRADPEDPDDRTGPAVEPGAYRVILTVDGVEHTHTVDVLEDIWLPPVR